ncbi:hypothetical protein [Cryptosporangium aurantiacum]|uniref:Uncharacterized protein n=1 Tax=Cryptosporangium aurantiacum TaxID=134849 RepID=A0A1M7TZ06_9ACTN|nr:hypothetical protein [Cryptosporangium aurantiacum]SHN75944.1 hypothetical protein SAMN05443668_107420 [Cryptosporangium aurantiacum]
MIVTEPAALATLVRRSRVVAVSFTIFSCAVYLWATLRQWNVPDALGRRVAYAGLLGLPFVLAVAHPMLFRRLRRRSRHLPGAFQLGSRDGRPALIAPKPHSPHGAGLILGGMFAAGRAGNLVTGEQDRYTQFLGLTAAMFLLAGSAWSMFGRPYLVIGADGVWVGSFRPALIRWDSISPTVLPASARQDRALRIPVAAVVASTSVALSRPAATASGVSAQTWNRLAGRGLDYDANVNVLLGTDPVPAPGRAGSGLAWIPLDLRAVATDHDLVANTIRYYRGNPAARAALGTEAGHSQLLNAVGKAEGGVHKPSSH